MEDVEKKVEPEEEKEGAPTEVEEWDADVVAVRMICVNNKEQFGQKTVRIKMKPSPDANYFCPATDFSTTVNATYEKDMIIMIKKDPFKDWGPFDYEPVLLEPEPPKPASPVDHAANAAAQAGTGDDFPNAFQDTEMAAANEKACPACTFNNYATATNCEICSTRL